MEQQIKTVYENLISLLPDLEKVKTALQRQDFYQANQILRMGMAYLEEVFAVVLEKGDYFFKAGIDTSKENVIYLLNSLLSTLETKEYIMLADILSQSVLPFLYGLQEAVVIQELAEPISFIAGSRNYQIEYTSCGLPTIKVIENGKEFYLHSNRNARQEAEELASMWFEPEKTDYIIYGMGLGYAVTALIEGNEYISAQVFESDAALLELSHKYGDYDRLIKSGRVCVKEDRTGVAFAAAAAKKPEAAIAFFYPSLRLISEKEASERMEDFFIRLMSQKTQYPAMCGNFKRNILCYDASIDVLKPDFFGKRVYLVAGGPSLDKNCDLLKKVKSDEIVIAVGTVLKKLLNRGIRPNYIVVSDAKANTFRQVEDICEEKIPLWGLSTAYYRFFIDYHAKHYLICQEGFEPAEKFAKEKGYFLVQAGGSVITVALDAVIKLGVREVIFIGLDLAYTGGKHHAEGMGHMLNYAQEGQRMVIDIYGNLVQTGRNLDIYRKFIEQKIAETKEVRFIDSTEGGAKIAGTEILPLAEILSRT